MHGGARGGSASRQIPRESNDRIEDDGDGQRQDDCSWTLRQPVGRFVQADLIDPSACRPVARPRSPESPDRSSVASGSSSFDQDTHWHPLLVSFGDEGPSRSDRRAGPSPLRADRRARCASIRRPARDRGRPGRPRVRPRLHGLWMALLGDRERSTGDPRSGARSSAHDRPSARRSDGRGSRSRHVGRDRPIVGLETHRRYRVTGNGPAPGPSSSRRWRLGRPMWRHCCRRTTSTTTATSPDGATRPTC